MLLKDLIPESFDEWRYERTRFSPRTHGSHWSPIRQTTRMPAPSRRYVHGDPIRSIDWRAWARTDQLLVRELREDASVTVEVHVEATVPMAWPDESVRGSISLSLIRKVDWAWRAACHICFGHIRMGDRVQLVVWEEDSSKTGIVRKSVRTLAGAKSIRDAYIAGPEFAGSVGGGKSKSSQDARRGEEAARVGTIYWLGDVLTSPEVTRCQLARGKCGALIHCLSSLELDIGWIDRTHCYVDQEPANKEFLGESLLAGTSYSDRIRTWQTALSSWCQEQGLTYGVFTEQSPVESYLRFLSSVGGRIRGQGGR